MSSLLPMLGVVVDFDDRVLTIPRSFLETISPRGALKLKLSDLSRELYLAEAELLRGGQVLDSWHPEVPVGPGITLASVLMLRPRWRIDFLIGHPEDSLFIDGWLIGGGFHTKGWTQLWQ